ncbi:hypothetical protein J5U18_10875 [Sphingobacteriaceae bacterium WQ 2009]|uniref:Thiol-activated cytolysin n=1 Tax=Rhinopithecimicrobium faecis TaxID=2820698 RepID=A0A8T4HD68_9SPHI|nr:hypothetical protein [Sphingobacteriaceae bacterium WQ 2009]
MNTKVKNVLLLALFVQGSIAVQAQTQTQTQTQTQAPTTRNYVSVEALKKYFSTRLNPETLTANKTGRAEKSINGTSFTLYPKLTNNSPFINADASKEENASRLYFEPTESKYKDIYLGAIFTEDKIKRNLKNIRQWNAFNGENIYLTGTVHSSNAQLSENAQKHIFLTQSSNHLTGAIMPKQADYTSISGIYTSKAEAQSMDIQVGGGYMSVSVDMGYSTSSSSTASSIKVVMVSKVYSLEVNKVNNIQATNKNYDIMNAIPYVDPKLRPMYVSSIDYGFAIEAEISSSELSEEQKAKLAANIEYGLASGKVGFDYGASLGSKSVDVKFTYYGVSPSIANKSGDIQSIIALMQSESRNFMRNFSTSNVPAIPLSCKMRYLFPKDVNSVANDVKINDLLLANDYVAVGKAAPKKLAAPVKAQILTGHMAGIKDGTFRSYGQCHVYLNTADKTGGMSYSYWYFYIDKRKSENVSKKEYYDKSGKDIFKIENPTIDEHGNFYVYARVEDYDCKPAGTDITFNTWTRSDNPINISEIKAGARKTITFFNKDLSFDLMF